MRVLHLVQQYWPFRVGSARYFQCISEYLAAQGHEVTVYTTDALEFEYFRDPHKAHASSLHEQHQAVKIQRFKVKHFRRHTKQLEILRSVLPFPCAKHLFSIPYVPSLMFRSLRRHTIDIVHAGLVPYGIMLYSAYLIAKKSGVPLVITPFLHIGEPSDRRIIQTHSDKHQVAIIKKADIVIAQTRLERDVLTSLGIDEKKIQIIGQGVNLESYCAGNTQRFRKKYAINSPIVMFLGTRAYDKGTIHLIQAMELLWRKGSEATLVLAGSSSNQDFISFFENQPNFVRNRCRILNDISDQDKIDLYEACDLFAMPSRNDSFGVAFLEAWAYRKPIIGAFAGGVPEVISDGVDGFLVPFGNIYMLGEYISSLLLNKSQAQEMGNRGLKKVASRYRLNDQMELISRIYRTLISK
jgi:glycogen synthase